jgi:hypothetical protein
VSLFLCIFPVHHDIRLKSLGRVNRMDDLLFYDIECYTFDSFVILKDIDRNSKLFHDKNGFEGLAAFIKGKTLVGYNNYFYDDHILCAMMDGWSQAQIKELNDRIIGGEKQKPKNRFRSLDCFQQIDVGFPSLKKIEGNRGKMILESSVPFDLPRPMEKNEYREAVDYCSYDVDNTIEIYQMRVNSYFAPKDSLVKMVGEKALRWNTTTLSANAILGNKTLPKWSDIRLNGEDFSDLSMLDLVPEDVVKLWSSGKKVGESKGKVVIEEFGCSIEFGFGGLHGVNKTQRKVKNVKLLDVRSMYPSIILIINALGEFSKRYKEILDERVRVKHLDKILSDALKLILNSVYGNLNNQYSSLYNPKGALSVCIYGQIALYTLCKRLAAHGHTIININTDGVGFVPNPHHDYTDVWKEFEQDFKLELEEDSFSDFIQKDVNNYIGVFPSGKIKCKGGDVARYVENIKKGQHFFFKNNSARIVDIAIVDKLLHGKSIIDTLIEHLDDPKLYQYIIQAGSTYQGTFDADGNKYNKVNRVFPTKKDGLCLYKKRGDDGLVRFPDLPERMYVWNDDCDKLEDFSKFVDLNHYVTVINKKLERWI